MFDALFGNIKDCTSGRFPGITVIADTVYRFNGAVFSHSEEIETRCQHPGSYQPFSYLAFICCVYRATRLCKQLVVI